jgi:nicotinamide mononucleotide transporter
LKFFDIHSIFFEVLGYSMSYLEFFGVIFGLVAVWLSAKANIWSWPLGIANVILAFFFYYQIQLYPDMFLQVFFFATNLVGWWRWAHPRAGEEDKRHELKVSYVGVVYFLLVLGCGVGGTLVVGSLASRLHDWFPYVFRLPSSYPYADSFILVMSVITTFLMIQKKIENWVIWIIVDILAAALYYIKGAKFYSAEYLVFTILASFGLWNWIKEYRRYPLS